MFELGNNELIYAAEDSFCSSPDVRKWSSAVHCCLAPHFRNGVFLISNLQGDSLTLKRIVPSRNDYFALGIGNNSHSYYIWGREKINVNGTDRRLSY